MNALTATDQPGALVITTPARLDQHPAAVYIAQLAPGARRTMRQALNAIAGMLTNGQADALAINWAGLRFQHTAAIRARLAEQYSAATANKMLSALRGTLKAAWQLGLIGAEDYQRTIAVENVTGSTLPAGRALTPGEIAALFEACSKDSSPAGVRDAALIALLYAGGLRRAEVCSLDAEDYDPGTGTVKVRGKRNKERMAYLESGAMDALADWLGFRGSAPGSLFCPVEKGGKIEHRRLNPQSIYNALAKRAKEAGVKELSPHDFRRTFVSDLLDAGADIATVQKLAGHANVNTTARYDRRGETAKKKAVGLLHVPYRRPVTSARVEA